MSEISEIYKAGGIVRAEEAPGKRDAGTNRRRRMQQGRKIMFWGGATLPLMMILAIMADGPGPLIAPFLIFSAGLIWWLYFRMFGDEDYSESYRGTLAGGIPFAPALPPQRVTPVSEYVPPRPDTNELAAPFSVTESTTRLLD